MAKVARLRKGRRRAVDDLLVGWTLRAALWRRGVEEARRRDPLHPIRLRYEGSLFKYDGGPDNVPYRRYLFEVAHAKVCVDLPGGQVHFARV
jgi:hypothetical protein